MEALLYAENPAEESQILENAKNKPNTPRGQGKKKEIPVVQQNTQEKKRGKGRPRKDQNEDLDQRSVKRQTKEERQQATRILN